MNETSKTLTFLGVAAAACVAAYLSTPTTAEFDASDEVGKPLTKAFDVEKAKRMKITRFDEDAAILSNFEVAQKGRLWSIPSKGGYPADAESQMAEAVDAVQDREILSVASKSPADHAQYGVIDPDSPKLDVGQTGVGTRVTLLDQSDKPLVDLIVGKQVKGAEGQHYVRRADQDFVYVVKIDPKDFSTTFDDWIEDDLLKINPWDIKEVRLNDYSAKLLMTRDGQLGVDTDYRSRLTLRYNDSDSKWEAALLERATDAQKGQFETFSLEENEELNPEKLDALKTALDDLRIVDVAKKPAGLSANLKAGDDFMKDNESLLSLIQRGFAPVGGAGGAADLLASDGEVVTTMKDGVEYVLRFGELQNASAGGENPKEGEEQEGQSVNRYLFVMARFNEDALEQPQLEEVPALPTGASEKADTDKPEEPKAEQEDKATEDSTEPAEDKEPAAEEPNTEQLIAQRKEIEQRNQRKLDEFASQIEAGKKKVAALNERFGDWYYVISNDVYKKIHLSREDVIKKKEAAEGEEPQGKQPDASAAGAPGSPIPGLPDLSEVGAGEPAPNEEKAEEPSDEKSEDAEESPAQEEAASEETGAAAE
jgi:hypothetical protein